MANPIITALTAAKKHPFISVMVIAALAGGGWYWQSQRAAAVKALPSYVLGNVTKGTLVMTVSGTGNVASTQQVDVKPKVSGTVTRVYVKNGDVVKAGAAIAAVDATDAIKTVNDARIALETAQLSLDKLRQPVDAQSILQSQNSLESAKETKANAEADLAQSYDDGFTKVSDAFLDLPSVMSGLNDVLFSNTITGSQANIDYYGDRLADYDRFSPFAADARAKYDVARSAYDAAFAAYKTDSRQSNDATKEALLKQTYDAALAISDAVKSASNLVQTYADKLTSVGKKPATQAMTHANTLSAETGTVNGIISSTLTVIRAMDADRKAIASADRTIAERTGSLAELQKGVDPLDIRSSQLNVDARQAALDDARRKLADYTVTAPFDGVIAATTLKRGDNVSSGTIAATLIAQQKMATISLNEVDAAKVQPGQAVTLTFDAIPDLTIAGSVAEVQALGATSQGVVTYPVQIAFDTQDARVRPSMTVTAAIITKAEQDVLMVPSGAVKGQSSAKYVLVVVNPPAASGAAQRGVSLSMPPVETAVEVGDSNDESTVIVSGVTEGETVVTSTISGSAATGAAAGATAPRGVQSLIGGGGGGNAAFRAVGGASGR
ncbi:MAG: hypothetical protein RLZZ324_835 [Candidatus Parcubacteria bacterium]